MKKNPKKTSQKFDKEDEREINNELNRYKIKYRIRTGHYPSEKLVQKEREKIIKKSFSDDKVQMHQTEKEDGQLRCLLDLLIVEKKHLTVEEMSQVLIESGYSVGSSVKTIYRRILPQLLDNGAIKDDENKFYIPPYQRNPEFEKKMATTMTERIEVASMISNFLETLKDTPAYEKAKEYIDKDLRVCKTRQSRQEDKTLDENNYVSRIIFMGAPAANIQNGIWETLNEAMQQNKYVSISYIGEGKRKAEKYTVKPYQLIFDNGFWELWGDCTTINHEGRKLFNLSRINKVTILNKGEPFILPENYDFRSTLAGNFGCYMDDAVENYSIKIKKDSYAYLYIKDRIWGEFQEIKEVKDGYVLEFEANQYLPVLRWVLSWGSEVQPLEPEKLVKDWKKEIRELEKIGS